MKIYILYLLLLIADPLFSQSNPERCSCFSCRKNGTADTLVKEIKNIKAEPLKKPEPKAIDKKIREIIINKSEVRVVNREYYSNHSANTGIAAYEISDPITDSSKKVFCTYAVDPNSYSYLDSIAGFLTGNKEIKIEIHGYADAGMSSLQKKYEERSSEVIAMAVQKYLIEHKVAASRFKIIKHGKSELLIEHPKTKEEHTKNNRVKLVFIQTKK